MKVRYGKSPSPHGRGVEINLTGCEVATAIDAYLVAQGVCVRGARTIRVNGELCKKGRVFVDPSGFVISDGDKFDGSKK